MPKKKKSVMNKKQQNKITRYLPNEVIMENILPRLPARDLCRFTSVSKVWQRSIDYDTRFAMLYSAYHNRTLSLSLDLLNVSKFNYNDNDDANDDDDDVAVDANDIEYVVNNYTFRLQKDNDNDDANANDDDDDDTVDANDINYLVNDCSINYNFELLCELDSLGCGVEPVGNCNGLACLKITSSVFSKSEQVFLINPIRKETVKLTCLTPKVKRGSSEYLCHGFGYDSLKKIYKVVLVYTTSAEDGNRGFICMVVTSKNNSWRKIVTSTCDISPPPGCSSFVSQMVTKVWNNDHKSATICGGDLLWRVTTSGDGENKEMLLLFDIHNERLRFIRLLDECNSLLRPMVNEGDREIAHHLLEFKGHLCVARSERILRNDYQFEVYMYVMKDKVEQIWIKEETFRFTLSQDIFEEHFSCTTDSNNNYSRPTRVLSFSDQVILYWFDGGCLIFYNLQMKNYEVVLGESSSNGQISDIFHTKIDGPDSNDDGTHCPWIDYQLHAQVESIISVKTFIHKRRDL